MIDTVEISAGVFIIFAIFSDAKTAFIMAAVTFLASTLLWFVERRRYQELSGWYRGDKRE